MLGHLFLLGLNEGLEPYVFGLKQAAKANKIQLNIEDMAVALADHDKRSNHEESSKGLTARFGKPNSRDNSRNPDKRIPTCEHCKGRGHTKQRCYFLNPNLRSEGWEPYEGKKKFVKENQDETDSEGKSGVKTVRSVKTSSVYRASSQKDTDIKILDGSTQGPKMMFVTTRDSSKKAPIGR